MKTLERAGLVTVLFALTLIPQLFAQQEVDPTWYDPWAKPAALVAPAVPANAAGKKKNQKSHEPAPDAVKAKKIIRDHDSVAMAHLRTAASK